METIYLFLRNIGVIFQKGELFQQVIVFLPGIATSEYMKLSISGIHSVSNQDYFVSVQEAYFSPQELLAFIFIERR
jgi:hypothetical protein